MFNETVRAIVYRVTTPLTALLVFYGVLEEAAAPLWIALVTGIFSGGLAIANTSTKTPAP